MLEIVRNSQDEIGLICTRAGFDRAVRLGDPLAGRFVGADVVGRIPMAMRVAGWFGAILLAMESLGAVYPNLDCSTLRIVDATGKVLAKGNRGILGQQFGTSRVEVGAALLDCRWSPRLGGWVIHGTRRK